MEVTARGTGEGRKLNPRAHVSCVTADDDYIKACGNWNGLMSIQSRVGPKFGFRLVCGGLAGSKAALFTILFDVVKTRYQTQGFDPKIGNVYDSRSTLLCIICIFKRLLSLEVLQLSPRPIQYEQSVEDDSSSIAFTRVSYRLTA
ncbi:Uncharacterized protein Fot_13361 [Forsythia ovata]|uniref:Uncharacterized protein n=1 Tax=Forsythia ovata TaxID=205694 RepID=A0ABD1W5S0_9LAMI